MGEVPNLSSEDVDTMITMMNDFSMKSEELYNAWDESVEHSIDSSTLGELDMMFTVMLEAGELEGIFALLEEYGMTNYAFAQDYIIKALESGIYQYYTIEELAKTCPSELLPVLDMHAAHLTDIFNWVEGRMSSADAAPTDETIAPTEPMEF